MEIFMEQTLTTLEFKYGSETLVIPKSVRIFLIDSSVDKHLCERGHKVELDEESFRKEIAECYRPMALKHVEEEGRNDVEHPIPIEIVESYIEQDLKEHGNRYVLSELYNYAYYRLSIDWRAGAENLMYCNEDIEMSDVN